MRGLPCGFFGGGAGEGPLVVVDFYEVAAEGNALKLLEEQAAFTAAAEAKLADELLVAGAGGGAAFDEADEFAVGLGVRGQVGLSVVSLRIRRKTMGRTL